MTSAEDSNQFTRFATTMEKYYQQMPDYFQRSADEMARLTEHARNEIAEICRLRSAPAAEQEKWLQATTKAMIGAAVLHMRAQVKRQSAIGVGPGLLADGFAATAAALVLSPATFDGLVAKELLHIDDPTVPANNYERDIQRAIAAGLLPADTDVSQAIAAIEKYRKERA